jgi:hypothetical protein
MQVRSHASKGDDMNGRFHERRKLTACTLAVAALALGGTGAAARADSGGTGPSAAHGYALALTALTGPQGGYLTIGVDAPAGTEKVDALKKVQLKIFAADGSLDDVRNLHDVDAPNGIAGIELGQVDRGRRVEADVLIQAVGRTSVARASTTTRLRPDLVVSRVYAPAQTSTSRPIDVVADIEELNGDTGATATATLMLGPTPLAPPQPVSVEAGAETSVTFTGVTVPAAVLAELAVVVGEAAPAETNATNNDGSTTVDVSEHELVPANVLVPSLGGYGAQLNQHVFAPITNLPASMFPDLESTVKAFEPQLVRIFYNENWEEPGQPRYNPENIVSFRRTVGLAQEAGATINVTYHTFADARLAPGPHMRRFADVLEDLVRNRGYTNVRWATVGNEPNSPGLALTLQQWEALYRALHAELVARGLRDHIRIMGGDLVESAGERDHERWFEHMTANMHDIVDAYSEHIYWWYDTFRLEGPRRFEFRLRDVRKLVLDDNPPERRRPTYIMEFAVRGLNTAPGKPTLQDAYYADGTELRRTNIAAFQQLWFNVASAQLGFTGTAKWDLYWGIFDLSSPGNQSYWMINPTADGWEVFPTYHALRLLLQTTQRGWQVVRVDPWVQDDWDPLVPDEPEKEIAAYAGSSGELTLIGLDTHGRALNGTSAETPTYAIGGLPPSTTFNLAIWNATGTGENSVATPVTTSPAGVARFAVPLHAAFALTTVPVS